MTSEDTGICSKDLTIIEEASDLWTNIDLSQPSIDPSCDSIHQTSILFYPKLCEKILNDFFPDISFSIQKSSKFYFQQRANLDFFFTIFAKTNAEKEKPLRKPPFIVQLLSVFSNIDRYDKDFVEILKNVAVETPTFEEINGVLTNGKDYHLHTIDYSGSAVRCTTRKTQ